MPGSKSLIAAASLALCSSASATNFSYTFLEIAAAEVRFDDDIVIAGSSISGVSQIKAGGLYQTDFGLVVGGMGFFQGRSEDNVSVRNRQIIAGAGYPIAITDAIDVFPFAGLIRTSTEVKVPGGSNTDNDSGLVYQLEMRAWANPDSIELGGGFSDTTIGSKDFRGYLYGSLWLTENHSIRLEGGARSESSDLSIGYRYSF